jgi:hypothetical protein
MRHADFYETSRRYLLQQEARRDRFLKRAETCIPYAIGLFLWWALLCLVGGAA